MNGKWNATKSANVVQFGLIHLEVFRRRQNIGSDYEIT